MPRTPPPNVFLISRPEAAYAPLTFRGVMTNAIFDHIHPSPLLAGQEADV
jgi:hypothetical protein